MSKALLRYAHYRSMKTRSTARVAPGGFVHHVLNRSVDRMHMFRKESDFEAFERVMVEVHERQPIRILSYCVLSNHWHFVAWPEKDGQLTDFFRRRFVIALARGTAPHSSARTKWPPHCWPAAPSS